MKKFLMIFSLVMLFSLCGCSEEAGNEPASVDALNRTMIAETLLIDENSRSIRFILGCLNTIGAGQIQSAESIVAEGEKAIDLIAEDGTNYRIYLSGSGSVESVKNLDTNEWPIQSER